MGDFEQAEKVLLEVKDIRGKLSGNEHLDYAKVLNNLAMLYQKQKKYELAEKYFIETMFITKKN